MPRQHPARFGTLLKTLRTAAGLTQEALAERAGVSVRGLQDLERGESRTPRRDTVELLASALGLAGAKRARFVAAGRLPPPEAGNAAAPPLPGAAMAPLIGRAGELSLLERFLDGEPGPLGAAPVLLLAGEPGMGKTHLLRAAAQRAVILGWNVLVGGCRQRGGQEPYAPLLDALAQYLETAGPGGRQDDLDGCAWLVRLLPELAPVLEPAPAGLAPEQERRLLYAAVARFLGNVAGPAGTLLVLDDLQWAGPDALQLLAALVRAGAPVRILGAYRDTEVGPADPLGLLLADLAPAGLARRHALGPLAPAEAAALLDDLLLDLTEAERREAAGVLQRAGGGALLPGELRAGVAPARRGGDSVGSGARGAAAGGAATRCWAGAAGRGGGGGPARAAGAAAGGGGAAGRGGLDRVGGGLPGTPAAGGGGGRLCVRPRPDPGGGGGRVGRGTAGDTAPQGGRGAGG